MKRLAPCRAIDYCLLRRLLARSEADPPVYLSSSSRGLIKHQEMVSAKEVELALNQGRPSAIIELAPRSCDGPLLVSLLLIECALESLLDTRECLLKEAHDPTGLFFLVFLFFLFFLTIFIILILDDDSPCSAQLVGGRWMGLTILLEGAVLEQVLFGFAVQLLHLHGVVNSDQGLVSRLWLFLWRL
jgi:hypothetical protein